MAEEVTMAVTTVVTTAITAGGLSNGRTVILSGRKVNLSVMPGRDPAEAAAKGTVIIRVW